MTDYTPGPWHVEQGDAIDGGWYVKGADGIVHGLFHIREDASAAAAAPDLLAALELAEATIRRLAQRSESAARSVLGTLDVTSAAIRNARGEN